MAGMERGIEDVSNQLVSGVMVGYKGKETVRNQVEQPTSLPNCFYYLIIITQVPPTPPPPLYRDTKRPLLGR